MINLTTIVPIMTMMSRHCVAGLQGCGKKKGSNTLRETCLSYVKPVIVQVCWQKMQFYAEN
jgi:hypothetical protein